MADKKRLIDADSCPCKDCLSKDYDCFARTCPDFAAWMASTVDAVEVVHGRWEKHMEKMEDGFGKFELVQTGVQCSVCGSYSCCGGNFCKNCGAIMDLEVPDG